MSDPTLSVTVTNYNYGRFLGRCIASIRAQSFEDFELILIDNASTDNSVDVMREHAVDDARLRVVAHPENRGRWASFHEGPALARGRYRVHVDADDFVMSRDAFKVQVDVLDAHPEMAFVYSALTIVGAKDEVLHVSHPYHGDRILACALALEQLLSFNINHCGLMHRLDVFRASDGYAEIYPQFADVRMAVRLTEHAELVGYLDRSLYGFRQHGTNLNLSPDPRIIEHEVLPVINEAFAGPVGAQVPNAAAVRRRIIRRDLVHFPTQYIFSGRPRDGWRLYWESFKLRPYDTVVQPRTLSLAARTLLGARGYARLVAALGRDHGPGTAAARLEREAAR